MTHEVAAALLAIAIGVGLASGVLICAASGRAGSGALLAAWPLPAVAVMVGVLVYADWAPPRNPGGDNYAGLVAMVLAALTLASTGTFVLGYKAMAQRRGRRTRGAASQSGR